MTLVPSTGGAFQIEVDGDVIWERKRDGGFPDVKTLKQRVRDAIDPERDLGHVDRSTRGDRANEARPGHQGPDCDHGAAPRAGERLSVGPEAGLSLHRPLHDRRSLRGRRCDRARRLRGPEGRAGRPPSAGRLPRADGVGGRPLRIPRRGGGDHHQAHPPPSAHLRRPRPLECRGGQGALGRDQGWRRRRSGRRAAPRTARREEHEPGCSRRRAGRPPRARPRREAAEEGRQGRLRLERSARGPGEDPRGDRRDRGGAGKAGARRPTGSRTRSATCSSPSPTSPAISTSNRRRR